MLSLRGSVWLILAKPPHVCLHEAPLAPLAPPATHALGHPSIEVSHRLVDLHNLGVTTRSTLTRYI